MSTSTIINCTRFLLAALILSVGLPKATLCNDSGEGEWQSVSIKLVDPAHPKEPERQFSVQVIPGPDGFPLEYAMELKVQVGNWMDQRSVEGTLFWNLAGGYRRFIPDEQHPLRKNTKVPFSETDYQELDTILRNPNSMLGNRGLDYLARPGQKDPAPDGISAATPKTLQRAAIENAVWTTWILWQYANGDTAERLRALTMENLTPGLLKNMLSSEDLGENAHALAILLEHHPGEEQYVPQVLESLEHGEFRNIRLALQFLEGAIKRESDLFAAVIDCCSRMNPGYVPMIVRFLKSKPSVSNDHLAKLSNSLESLPYYPVCSILDLLEERAVFPEDVMTHVNRLKEADSEQIAYRAKQFIEARELFLSQ